MIDFQIRIQDQGNGHVSIDAQNFDNCKEATEAEIAVADKLVKGIVSKAVSLSAEEQHFGPNAKN